MNYLNLEPRQRNNYTPEFIRKLFARTGGMKAAARVLGVHPASLSRNIARRASLVEARAKGMEEYGRRIK